MQKIKKKLMPNSETCEDYNDGNSFIANAFATNIAATTAANITSFNSIDRADTVKFTLPASARGFAFTGHNTT